jgi:hypothetical protein
LDTPSFWYIKSFFFSSLFLSLEYTYGNSSTNF